MPQENAGLKERTNYKIKEPKKYNVVFYNDDFTPMDFVVAILTEVFYLDLPVAEQKMLQVHNEGKAIVATYSYDMATSKTAKATSIARELGYPLRIKVEPA